MAKMYAGESTWAATQGEAAMRHKLISLGSTVGVLSCCLLGCQANNQSEIRLARHVPEMQTTTTVALASFRTSPSLIQQPQTSTTKANMQNANQANVAKPVQKITLQANNKDAEEETAATTATKTLYTAPSSASALAIASAALGSTQDIANGGQEASENINISASFRQALQPSVSIGDGGSIGKRGLQRGSPLTGSNNLNIFTPRSNGITNRCQELITAGFFADVTGCRNHFRR